MLRNVPNTKFISFKGEVLVTMSMFLTHLVCVKPGKCKVVSGTCKFKRK